MSDGLIVNSYTWSYQKGPMSKCLMGNLFDKVGYDGLTFLKKTIEWVTESYRHRVNFVGYGK